MKMKSFMIFSSICLCCSLAVQAQNVPSNKSSTSKRFKQVVVQAETAVSDKNTFNSSNFDQSSKKSRKAVKRIDGVYWKGKAKAKLEPRNKNGIIVTNRDQ